MLEEAKPASSFPLLPDAPAPAHPATRQRQSLTHWQQRLLPYMMGAVLVFGAFFFISSLIQLAVLTNNIAWKTDQEADSMHQALSLLPPNFQGMNDQALAAYRFQELARLDLYLLQRRYHEANVLLMAGVWVRYLGFVTGMILALLGAVFVIGKLREPAAKVSGEAAGIKAAFEGASPGMFMVAVGTLMMIVTIVSHQQYDLTDAPVFVQMGTQSVLIAPPVPTQSAAIGKPPPPTLKGPSASPTPTSVPAPN